MFRRMRKNRLRKKLGPPVIVVSGLPRSGTSMMMKMLDAAGLELFVDNIRVADEDNPKGYFEYEPVKELANTENKSWLRQSRGKVLKVISFLLPHLAQDCFYRIIFMRRDLHEIMASQNRMLERRGEPVDADGGKKMIGIWERHLRKIGVHLEVAENLDVIEVNYNATLENPREQARRVSEFLGGGHDLDAMAAVVDEQLYRNRRDA